MDHRAEDDVYAQRISGAGIAQWTANGIPICIASGDQDYPGIVSDDAGGAIITWEDNRAAANIYAQRVNGAGTTLWAANGLVVCSAVRAQEIPVILADSAGGAFIVWRDYRSNINYEIYAQRIDGSGAGYWASNGVPIRGAGPDLFDLEIAHGGFDGFVLAWCQGPGPADIYAQRVDGTGIVAWGLNGIAVCAVWESQYDLEISTDGARGVILTWTDYRDALNGHVYAQWITNGGIPQWGTTWGGERISSLSNFQSTPSIATDEQGGAIICWKESEGWDIFMKQMPYSENTGVAPPAPTTRFALHRNVPNPFNPITTIPFELKENGDVRVAVYSVEGRLVATILNEPRSAGAHSVTWNGTDDRGRSAHSGVYFYRLIAGPEVESRRMVLLR